MTWVCTKNFAAVHRTISEEITNTYNDTQLFRRFTKFYIFQLNKGQFLCDAGNEPVHWLENMATTALTK